MLAHVNNYADCHRYNKLTLDWLWVWLKHIRSYWKHVLWDTVSPICKWGAENGRQAYCLFLLLVYMQHGPLQNTSSKMKLSRMSRQQLNTLIRADCCQVQGPGWLPRCMPMTLTLNPGPLVWNSSLRSGQGHVSKIMFPERDWVWLGKDRPTHDIQGSLLTADFGLC